MPRSHGSSGLDALAPLPERPWLRRYLQRAEERKAPAMIRFTERNGGACLAYISCVQLWTVVVVVTSAANVIAQAVTGSTVVGNAATRLTTLLFIAASVMIVARLLGAISRMSAHRRQVSG